MSSSSSSMERSSLSRGAIIAYLLIALSLGAQGAFFLSEVPYLMRRLGTSIESIGWYSTVAAVPYIMLPLVNPITDQWIRRRTWFLALSLGCVLSIVVALYAIARHHSTLFYTMSLLGQVQYALAYSCYGGLASENPDKSCRLQASNLLNFGAQGGGAIAATLFLMMTERLSLSTMAILTALMIGAPAFAALAVPEPVSPRERKTVAAGTFLGEIGQTLRDKQGLFGLILCACPAGTLALNSFFPALAVDYHASQWLTVGLNGYLGWLLTLIGIYFGARACRRFDFGSVYIVSSILMAAVGAGLALVPPTGASYGIGFGVYCIVQGGSLTSCSALIVELISRSRHSSSTQYSIFYASNSLAQMYVLALDTHFYSRHGLQGLYVADAGLNLLGAALLIFLIRSRNMGTAQ